MGDNQWDSVSWNKTGEKQKGVSRTTQLNRAMRSGAVDTQKKYGGGGNAQSGTNLNTKALDEDHDNLKHAKVSVELKKSIQQERMAAQMTQKDLATACNVKPNIIQDYEAGKGMKHDIISII
mmetsp:Transcript_20506/g.24861  ORF Transcript_20506/g.24861 Transcript_20506/m.24861 type:complete len:122 (-) Transcript_20506:628-993(-)